MTPAPAPEIRLNGVRYRWPDRPVVVVCNDGGDPAYVDRALKDGILPNVARFRKTGFNAVAECVIPSFTCPNNVSIITGSPPSIHGISGNFYLEPETGKAVVMTGPELMRSTTILAEFSHKGAKVASITAKDKLRHQLGKDMNIAGGSINFSSEKAINATSARMASRTCSISSACLCLTCTQQNCRCSCSRRGSNCCKEKTRSSCIYR
jgi:phosphonoacetate hydrolase